MFKIPAEKTGRVCNEKSAIRLERECCYLGTIELKDALRNGFSNLPDVNLAAHASVVRFVELETEGRGHLRAVGV